MKWALQGDQGSSGSTWAITGAMTWREVLSGPFTPTQGFELSWSMLKTWPVRAEALLESRVPALCPPGAVGPPEPGTTVDGPTLSQCPLVL